MPLAAAPHPEQRTAMVSKSQFLQGGLSVSLLVGVVVALQNYAATGGKASTAATEQGQDSDSANSWQTSLTGSGAGKYRNASTPPSAAQSSANDGRGTTADQANVGQTPGAAGAPSPNGGERSSGASPTGMPDGSSATQGRTGSRVTSARPAASSGETVAAPAGTAYAKDTASGAPTPARTGTAGPTAPTSLPPASGTCDACENVAHAEALGSTNCPDSRMRCNQLLGTTAPTSPIPNASKATLCRQIVDCVHRTHCAKDFNLTDCLCGTHADPNVCFSATLAEAAGPCRDLIAAGGESNLMVDLANRFSDPTFAIGAAAAVVETCDYLACAKECL
jgi:hypothetical protein